MTDRFAKLALSALLVSSMISGLAFEPRNAAAAPVRLTKAQEVELPVVYYDSYGKETKEKSLFRTDGDYEWKWSISSAVGLLPEDEERPGIRYFDYNENVYGTDANGQRTWMKAVEEDDGLTQLGSGNYIAIDPDDSAYVSIDGDEEKGLFPIKARKATVYDRNKRPLFAIDFYDGKNAFDSFLFEDPNGNLIALQDDGIVSTDPTGKRNWVYNDGIVIDKSFSIALRANVVQMGIDVEDHLIVKTGDRVLTLDSKGQVIQQRAYRQLKYEYEKNHFYEFEANEEGLVWYNGEYVTPEDAVKRNLEMIASINSAVSVTKWAKGSYTTESTSLVSLDIKGSVKWTFKKYTYGVPENILADKDGNVFFSDARGNIYGLDEKGNEKFHLYRNDPGDALTRLTLTPEGDLIGTTKGLGMFCISKRHENLIVDGMAIALGAKPIVKNGVFLVPYRAAFAKLGIKLTMDKTKKWTIATSKAGTTLKFRHGDVKAYLNGKAIQMTVSPQQIGVVDYLPTQWIADLLGKRMEWDKLRGTATIGNDALLAETAVRRLLTAIEHGEETIANDLLSIKGSTFAAKAPGIKRKHSSERWVIDVLGLKTTKLSATEYRVEVKQHNRKYFYSDGPLIDETQTFAYQVKLASDGRWKVSSSTFVK